MVRCSAVHNHPPESTCHTPSGTVEEASPPYSVCGRPQAPAGIRSPKGEAIEEASLTQNTQRCSMAVIPSFSRSGPRSDAHRGSAALNVSASLLFRAPVRKSAFQLRCLIRPFCRAPKQEIPRQHMRVNFESVHRIECSTHTIRSLVSFLASGSRKPIDKGPHFHLLRVCSELHHDRRGRKLGGHQFVQCSAVASVISPCRHHLDS